MTEDLAVAHGGLRDRPGPLAAVDVRDRAFHAWLGCCAFVSVVLGAATIAREPLWNDEIATLAVVERSFSEFVAQLPDRQNGMLFDVVLWPLVQIFGPSSAVARAPALVAMVGAVVLCGLVGSRLAGRVVGMLAAALLAVHPATVYYAQEARPYGFVVLFSLLSVWTLLRALDRPSLARWIVYALSVAALAYSHDFAVLALLAHFVLGLTHANRRVRRSFGVVLGLLIVLALPLLLLVPDDWGSNALYWVPEPTIDQVRASAGLLGARQAYVIPIALVLSWALISPSARRRASEVVDSVPRTYAFLGTWLLAPTVVLYLVSQFMPVLVPRYTLASLPAVCLALALALALMRPRVAVVLATAFVAAFLVRSIDDDVELTKTDWPGAASYLASAAAPDEPIVVVGDSLHHANALLYYAPSFGVGRDELLWTREDRNRLPAQFVLIGGGGRGTELVQIPTRSETAWLVLSNFVSDDVQANLDRLAAACEEAQERSFTGIQVVRLSGCSEPS
jgi:mannosyltransferase